MSSVRTAREGGAILTPLRNVFKSRNVANLSIGVNKIYGGVMARLYYHPPKWMLIITGQPTRLQHAFF